MEREREMHISHQTDNTRPIIWRERERCIYLTRLIILGLLYGERERERDAYISPD